MAECARPVGRGSDHHFVRRRDRCRRMEAADPMGGLAVAQVPGLAELLAGPAVQDRTSGAAVHGLVGSVRRRDRRVPDCRRRVADRHRTGWVTGTRGQAGVMAMVAWTSTAMSAG